MLSFDIKALLNAHLSQKILYHVILIILIVFTYSGICLPRIVDKNYEDKERKSSPEVSGNIHPEDNHIADGLTWSLKTKRFSDNMLEVRDDKFKKNSDFGFKTSQKHFATRLEHEKSQEVKSNGKIPFVDASFNGHTNGNVRLTKDGANEQLPMQRQRQHGRIISGYDDDDDDRNLSHEKHHVDSKSQYNITNEKIMDYFFNHDARGQEGHRRVRNQGVIINLRGLIPYEDAVSEKRQPSTTDREVKGGNGDDLLAFKAFEIDSSPQPDSVSTLFTDDDEEGANHVIDISKVTSRVEFIDEDMLESRHLSRKRRQRASPNAEQTEDEEQSRHRFFRRRRRKRKRRHRHSKNVDEALEESDVARQPFSLKSHSPAYVITSAKELKKDWCRTVPLKQRIEAKNCKPKIISNNFCYGQCNSFFIPHQGRTGNGAAFQSCAFCKPNKRRWINVTLHCPGEERNRVEKRILFVESCRCMTEVLH